MKNKEYAIILGLVVVGVMLSNYIHDKFVSGNITKVA